MTDYDRDDQLLRQGRHVGRTLYLTPLDQPDADGVLIGVVDSVELAYEICIRWNAVAVENAGLI